MPTLSDLGKTIAVTATASLSGYVSATATRCSDQSCSKWSQNSPRQREVGGGLDYEVGRSRETALGLEAEAPEEVTRVDTGGRAVTHVAAEIIRLSGWHLE